jgi:hypothetical protein
MHPSLMVPQFFICAAHVVGTHGPWPHTFAEPPPPHVIPAAHIPQSSVPPHPSGIVPQFLFCGAHVVGVHPQTFAMPAAPQVWGAAQVPQSKVALHPSLIVPQFLFWAAHVAGTQVPCPQMFGWPVPPHVSDPEQAPQSSVAPHASGIVPQFLPCAAHDTGVQPVPASPPPPPLLGARAAWPHAPTFKRTVPSRQVKTRTGRNSRMACIEGLQGLCQKQASSRWTQKEGAR